MRCWCLYEVDKTGYINRRINRSILLFITTEDTIERFDDRFHLLCCRINEELFQIGIIEMPNEYTVLAVSLNHMGRIRTEPISRSIYAMSD